MERQEFQSSQSTEQVHWNTECHSTGWPPILTWGTVWNFPAMHPRCSEKLGCSKHETSPQSRHAWLESTTLLILLPSRAVKSVSHQKVKWVRFGYFAAKMWSCRYKKKNGQRNFFAGRAVLSGGESGETKSLFLVLPPGRVTLLSQTVQRHWHCPLLQGITFLVINYYLSY